jgi:hypothetical protein
MGFDYQRSRELAGRLISWFGRDMELIRAEQSDFDPALGAPAKVTTATFSAVGAVLGIDQGLVDGSQVRCDDRRVLLSAQNLAGQPLPGDKLVFGGRSYAILEVSPLMPADTEALYELHIREGG